MRKMIRAIRWSRIYPLSLVYPATFLAISFVPSDTCYWDCRCIARIFFPRNVIPPWLLREIHRVSVFFFEPPGCRFVYRNSHDRLVMNVPSFVFFVSFFFPSSSFFFFFFFWATMDLACKIIRTNNLHWLDVLFTLYRRFYSWIFCTYNREYFVRIIYL